MAQHVPGVIASHCIRCAGVEYVQGEKAEFAKKRVLAPEREVHAIINVTKHGSTNVICPFLCQLGEEEATPLTCSAPLQEDPDLANRSEECSARLSPCPYIKTTSQIAQEIESLGD